MNREPLPIYGMTPYLPIISNIKVLILLMNLFKLFSSNINRTNERTL